MMNTDFFIKLFFDVTVDANNCKVYTLKPITTTSDDPAPTNIEVANYQLCEKITKNPVIAIVSIDEDTWVPTPSFWDVIAWAPYAWATSNLEVCTDSNTEVEYKAFCDAWTNFLRWFVSTDGVIDPTKTFDTDLSWNTYTTVWAVTPWVCVITDDGCPLTREVYRIDWTASWSSTNLQGWTWTVWETVTITAPFKSIGTNILRQTEEDPWDWSVATIEVDWVEYYMWGWNAYFTDIPDWGTNDCSEEYTQDITFTATWAAYLEILVTRK